jgi:CBS domain-containing protein
MRIQDLAQPVPVTITADATVVSAAGRMRRYHVGDVIVTEPEGSRGRPIGILTDRDVTIGIVSTAPDAIESLTVGDVLSRDELVTIHEDDSIHDAIELLHAHGIRRLPIVDGNDQLLGIVTLDDLIAHLSQQLEKLASVVSRQRARESRERT